SSRLSLLEILARFLLTARADLQDDVVGDVLRVGAANRDLAHGANAQARPSGHFAFVVLSEVCAVSNDRPACRLRRQRGRKSHQEAGSILKSSCRVQQGLIPQYNPMDALSSANVCSERRRT